MSDLAALIRLRKWELDERKREIGQLFQQAEGIAAEIERLNTQMQSEGEAVRDLPEVAMMTGSFAEGQMLRLEAMGMMRQQIEAQIEQAQARLQAAFQELRSVELVEEDRKARALAAEQKSAQARLDEVAVEGWRRNQEG